MQILNYLTVPYPLCCCSLCLVESIFIIPSPYSHFPPFTPRTTLHLHFHVNLFHLSFILFSFPPSALPSHFYLPHLTSPQVRQACMQSLTHTSRCSREMHTVFWYRLHMSSFLFFFCILFQSHSWKVICNKGRIQLWHAGKTLGDFYGMHLLSFISKCVCVCVHFYMNAVMCTQSCLAYSHQKRYAAQVRARPTGPYTESTHCLSPTLWL